MISVRPVYTIPGMVVRLDFVRQSALGSPPVRALIVTGSSFMVDSFTSHWFNIQGMEPTVQYPGAASHRGMGSIVHGWKPYHGSSVQG